MLFVQQDSSGPPNAKRPKSSEGSEDVKETAEVKDPLPEENTSSGNTTPKPLSSSTQGESGKEKEKKPIVPEPSFEMLSNPARVLPQQVII